MSYVIENVALYENDEIKQTNFVIKHNRIYSRDTSVNKLRFTRMRMDGFIMTAGETVIGNFQQWQKEGTSYVEKIVMLGATTVLFPIDIQFEYQLPKRIFAAKKNLSSFPLDYCLILRLPLSLLKTSVVRYCKQQRIPVIITIIQTEVDLSRVPWSWLKEAFFPYKLVFIPQLIHEQKETMEKWDEILKQEKIPHCSTLLTDHQFLSTELLKLIGLYPFKGTLRNNGEISYNFIREKHKYCLINKEKRYYDKIECTIFKNQVIRVGNSILLPKNPGVELCIKVPGFFE